jgi:hypothetical protein
VLSRDELRKKLENFCENVKDVSFCQYIGSGTQAKIGRIRQCSHSYGDRSSTQRACVGIDDIHCPESRPEPTDHSIRAVQGQISDWERNVAACVQLSSTTEGTLSTEVEQAALLSPDTRRSAPKLHDPHTMR